MRYLLQVEYATTESVVTVDWENGFVEASAAINENVTQVSLKNNNNNILKFILYFFL